MENAKDKERILIVDDSPATLEMLERNLRSEGYEVLAAPGVAEAIKILDDNPLDDPSRVCSGQKKDRAQ